jgi:hypothetical protein
MPKAAGCAALEREVAPRYGEGRKGGTAGIVAVAR